MDFIIDFMGYKLEGQCEYEVNRVDDSYSHEFGIEEKYSLELEEILDFFIEFVDGEYINEKQIMELNQYNKEIRQILFDYVASRI